MQLHRIAILLREKPLILTDRLTGGGGLGAS